MTICWLIVQAGMLSLESWLFLTFSYRPVFLFAGHTLAMLLFVLAFGRSLAFAYPLKGATLLGGILVFFLPVAGMACAFLIALLLIYKPLPPGDLLGEFQEHTTLPDIVDSQQKLPRAGTDIIQAQNSVEPLVDMLATPDPQFKKAILDAIAKRKNPKLIPHIIAALEDPRPEIYQFAIAKVAQLQHDFGLEITRATEAANNTPEDLESHHRLAQVYDNYLKSGLVDQSVIGFYQDQLLKEYEKILALSPKEGATLKNLGRLFSETGKWKEAEKTFKRALALRPNDPETKFEIIKILYERNRYREMFEQLRQVREELVSGAGTNKSQREMAEWWLSPDTETVEAHA